MGVPGVRGVDAAAAAAPLRDGIGIGGVVGPTEEVARGVVETCNCGASRRTDMLDEVEVGFVVGLGMGSVVREGREGLSSDVEVVVGGVVAATCLACLARSRAAELKEDGISI